MNKINLVTGGRGKIGSILCGRADFVFLDCDITDINSTTENAYGILGEEFDFGVVVNLAAISSVDECERDYEKAIKVNTHGLANLHKVFGDRVLNISSDQVFSGNSLFLPNERTKPSPINSYGYSKLGAETVSQAFGGKTLRLSRTYGKLDGDIVGTVDGFLKRGDTLAIPTFFSRNYMHRVHAVDAIEYMVRNWDSMPQIVNYGGLDHITQFGFMRMLAIQFGFDPNLIQKRYKYYDEVAPRPRNGGFKVGLAEGLGFPMYTVMQTIEKLKEEFSE